MEQTNVNIKDTKIFARLMRFAAPVKFNFIISLILMIISVGANTVFPLINSAFLEELGQDSISVDKLYFLFFAFIFVLIVIIIASYFQSLFLQKAGQRIIYDIRQKVFYKIENFSNEQLNEIPVGKLVTRVTNDTQAISEMYTNILVGFIRNILQIVFVFIFMFITSKKLSLITLCIAPVVLIASIIFRKFSRNAYRNVRKCISNMNAFLSENISGIKITQGFSQEEKQLEAFNKTNKALLKASLQEILVFGIFRPFIYVIYISTVTLVLYIGGKEFLTTGAIGYVVIYTFYLYIEQFFQPIQQIAEQFNTLQSAFAASERIFDILDTEPLIKDADNAIDLVD